jgi:hypothetical protein
VRSSKRSERNEMNANIRRWIDKQIAGLDEQIRQKED